MRSEHLSRERDTTRDDLSCREIVSRAWRIDKSPNENLALRFVTVKTFQFKTVAPNIYAIDVIT